MLLTVAHPFDRPLAVGDTGQIQAMRRMNGETLYCPHCFCTPPRRTQNLQWHYHGVCPECGKCLLEYGPSHATPSVFDRPSLKGLRYDWRKNRPRYD